MKPILFSLFEPSTISAALLKTLDLEEGKMTLHRFPDGESGVTILSDVNNREIIVVMSLNQPNEKCLPLIFFAQTARELGATKIGLISPYLAYLRQDKRFHPGEGITSRYFAGLLSASIDWLMTIDPHLHRYHSLDEIYTIPGYVLHATTNIATWIQHHVEKPMLIGPDKESEQWVAQIAKHVNAPYLILEKTRHGDKQVDIHLPDIQQYQSFNPVLVDDIISTARTMATTVTRLKKVGFNTIYGVGVHAIFAEEAYPILLATGITQIVTCNTIPHETNAIDVSDIIIESLIHNKIHC